MNPAITNLLFSLGAMQVARKIDFEQKDTLQLVRIGYVASQLICLLAYYYVSVVIKRKNDLKVLTYVEPKAPMQQEPGAQVTTTNRDYDLSEVSKAVRSVLIGIAFMSFMHGYLKYTQPLFIQAIMGIKGLYDSKILQLHILGRPATGDLKRPFEPAPSFLSPAAKTEEAAAAPATSAVAAAVEDKKTK
ncbi:BQ2448_7551 [Microbotryum intermedium]|uniref:BQ2448_7551 protein n=1 Tax=Microbotryum intermedium TaxID=269621 RepID=A0A238FL76_9BASI|nr:BQ2448_7551 [Microbotryum intermedium]